MPLRKLLVPSSGSMTQVYRRPRFRIAAFFAFEAMVRVGFAQVIKDLFFCSDIDFGDEVRSGTLAR